MNATSAWHQGDAISTADFTAPGRMSWERQFWATSTLPSAVSEPPSSVDFATDTTSINSPLAYVQLFLRINGQFRRVISEAKGEQFFDGITSRLAEATRDIITANGPIAVEALQQVLNIQHDELAGIEEILRQIGLIQDESTHQARLSLLVNTLGSSQEQIRDAAMLGLSFLEDRAALPYLRQALQQESAPWLAENLEMVIEQLERI